MNPARIPGWEGTTGPFPRQYDRPHVYARDVHSGAGNCVCGAPLGHRLHVQAAPGVDVPDRLRPPNDDAPTVWDGPGQPPGYTAHGHWIGPDRPVPPYPRATAKCGGPRGNLCQQCRQEAETARQFRTGLIEAIDAVVLDIQFSQSLADAVLPRLLALATERNQALEQRDEARDAVAYVFRLAQAAHRGDATLAPQGVINVLGDVALKCPNCWRMHHPWCPPHGGPQADGTWSKAVQAAEADSG